MMHNILWLILCSQLRRKSGRSYCFFSRDMIGSVMRLSAVTSDPGVSPEPRPAPARSSPQICGAGWTSRAPRWPPRPSSGTWWSPAGCAGWSCARSSAPPGPGSPAWCWRWSPPATASPASHHERTPSWTWSRRAAWEQRESTINTVS